MKDKKITGRIIDIKELSGDYKKQMYSLFTRYFVVEEKTFFSDLNEKEKIILLFANGTKKIKGFSTLKTMRVTVDGTKIKAVFSGDTIVDSSYRNELDLMKHFGRYIYNNMEKGVKFYWFLISMGFRTYRFLPLIFEDYYPRYDRETPVFEKKIIDVLAYEKFGKAYNKEKGVIIPRNKNFLKVKHATIPLNRLTNPHIKYFLRSNPGYTKGDELACITEIKKENFKPIFYRITGC
ncbi:hypothetical protein JW879_06870 [candidate division WOR-3 bacterium]|nr:hypothetical protein [candidate division WOR-3 bacterium]